MNTGTPVSVFYAAVGALKAKAWQQAAELCDPVSLSVFKRDLIARLQYTPLYWTVEKLLQYQPDLPREVAEYQVANLNKHSDPRDILVDEVPSIPSVQALESLPPAAVFAAWLEGQSHERQVERATRHSRVPPEAVAEALQRPLETDYEVLGTVNDGERLAHVVFRTRYVGPEESDEPVDDVAKEFTDEERSLIEDRDTFVEFSTLRRQPDGCWCMIAGHGFLGRNNPVFVFGSTDEGEFENV